MTACGTTEHAPATTAPPAPSASPSPTIDSTLAVAPAPSASPSAPTTPTYDLAADRLARTTEARSELGQKSNVEVVEDVFVFVAPPGAAVAPAVAFAKKALSAYFHGRFAKRPAQAITVYLFPDATGYEAYCESRWKEKCISVYGFYAPKGRRMVMNVGLGIGTLTHELVHPIVETDFPGAPTWLDEGIASLFEAPTFPAKDEVHGVKNWRYPKLEAALATQKPKTRLSILFGMSDATFRGADEKLNYALSRYFCQYLDHLGALWQFYQKYRDGHATDPTGEKALLAATGKTPDQLQSGFEAWFKAL